MWAGWKAKFLSSNAALLDPDRAHAIIDEFLASHPHFNPDSAIPPAGDQHAAKEGEVEGDGFV